MSCATPFIVGEILARLRSLKDSSSFQEGSAEFFFLPKYRSTPQDRLIMENEINPVAWRSSSLKPQCRIIVVRLTKNRENWSIVSSLTSWTNRTKKSWLRYLSKQCPIGWNKSMAILRHSHTNLSIRQILHFRRKKNSWNSKLVNFFSWLTDLIYLSTVRTASLVSTPDKVRFLVTAASSFEKDWVYVLINERRGYFSSVQ